MDVFGVDSKRRRCLHVDVQPPTLKNVDIPDSNILERMHLIVPRTVESGTTVAGCFRFNITHGKWLMNQALYR